MKRSILKYKVNIDNLSQKNYWPHRKIFILLLSDNLNFVQNSASQVNIMLGCLILVVACVAIAVHGQETCGEDYIENVGFVKLGSYSVAY